MHLPRSSIVSSIFFFLLSSTVQGKPKCVYKKSTQVSAPSVAAGYATHLLSDGLNSPRGMLFDSEGHLLVVESGTGIRALTLSNKHGCVSVTHSKLLISDSSLNHGIELSHSEGHLFASSSDTVFRWQYDSKKIAVGSSKDVIVTNMTNSDHTTRTLLLSKKKRGTLIVSRGSADNIDNEAEKKSTGHAQIKAFNLHKKAKQPYDFTSDGNILAWGVRNDVGIDEEPVHGGLYSVENSVDEISRYGINFHENNPGEELNYLGTILNNKSPNQGSNFGYPQCFSAWKVDEIPKHRHIQVGTQFAVNPGEGKISDDWCRNQRTAPRLVFQAHMAPLSILFNPDGSDAWITFHGSWDRTNPVGYAVAKVKFAKGEPVEPSHSIKAAKFIAENPNIGNCPYSCFRPVGLAMDNKGRVYFSSDQTGEIYMIESK